MRPTKLRVAPVRLNVTLDTLAEHFCWPVFAFDLAAWLIHPLALFPRQALRIVECHYHIGYLAHQWRNLSGGQYIQVNL